MTSINFSQSQESLFIVNLFRSLQFANLLNQERNMSFIRDSIRAEKQLENSSPKKKRRKRKTSVSPKKKAEKK